MPQRREWAFILKDHYCRWPNCCNCPKGITGVKLLADVGKHTRFSPQSFGTVFRLTVQFIFQDGIFALGKAHPVCRKFPQRHLWNGSIVRLNDDGPLSSFQGRSSSASSFDTSGRPGDRWCDVLGFMPVGSFWSSTLQIFREASRLWELLCPPVYLLGCFPLLRHVQGSTPTGVYEDGCRPLTHSSLGFPFHFSLFVASSLNLWGWWHVLSDCHLLRQSPAWVTTSTSIVKLEVELAVLHTSCVNSGQSDVWQMEQWLRTFPWSRKLRVGSRESSREQSTSIWHRRNAEELSCHSHLNDFYVKEENSTRGRQRWDTAVKNSWS